MLSSSSSSSWPVPSVWSATLIPEHCHVCTASVTSVSATSPWLWKEAITVSRVPCAARPASNQTRVSLDTSLPSSSTTSWSYMNYWRRCLGLSRTAVKTATRSSPLGTVNNAPCSSALPVSTCTTSGGNWAATRYWVWRMWLPLPPS